MIFARSMFPAQSLFKESFNEERSRRPYFSQLFGMFSAQNLQVYGFVFLIMVHGSHSHIYSFEKWMYLPPQK